MEGVFSLPKLPTKTYKLVLLQTKKLERLRIFAQNRYDKLFYINLAISLFCIMRIAITHFFRSIL